MKEFSSEVTVYVWRFHGPKKPGHASVKITGIPGAENDYVSWWPGRGGAGKSTAHEEKMASRNVGYKNDAKSEMSQTTREAIEFKQFTTLRTGQRQFNMGLNESGGTEWTWGQAATEKVKLPGIGANDLAGGGAVTFGLDLAKMHEWWTVFKFCPHPTYKYASKHKNCSGVAAAALRAGGADRFATPPTALIYIDPNQIGDWAKRVRAELDRKNRKAKDVQAAVLAAGEVRWDDATELMSVRQWKTLSNQNMGLCRARSEKVQEMDRALQEYHRYHWSGAMAFTKFRLLGQLMDAVHYYLGYKAGSKRGDAVVTLGKQVLSTIKAKTLEFPVGNGIQNDQLLWMQQDLLVR